MCQTYNKSYDKANKYNHNGIGKFLIVKSNYKCNYTCENNKIFLNFIGKILARKILHF